MPGSAALAAGVTDPLAAAGSLRLSNGSCQPQAPEYGSERPHKKQGSYILVLRLKRNSRDHGCRILILVWFVGPQLKPERPCGQFWALLGFGWLPAVVVLDTSNTSVRMQVVPTSAFRATFQPLS